MIVIKFFFYSGLVVPTIIALISKLIENNLFWVRIYIVNIITIYFIIVVYLVLYYCILRKFKFVKEMVEGN